MNTETTLKIMSLNHRMIALEAIRDISMTSTRTSYDIRPERLTLLLSLMTVLLLSGCSFIDRNTIGLFSSENTTSLQDSSESIAPDTDEDASKSSLQTKQPNSQDKLAPANRAVETGTKSQLELVWAVPETPTDSFIIHYGTSRDALVHQVKVSIKDLETFDDGKNGFVYRYVSPNIPASESKYVAISAVKGDVVSPLSKIISVEGDEVKQ